MTDTKPNRSDFIRKHPELSPSELVELGAKQGLTFSKNLVYLVRGPRASSTGEKATRPKHSRAARRPKKSRASDFIRRHPDLSPAALVALGREQGIKFSRNLIYTVRGPVGGLNAGRSGIAPVVSGSASIRGTKGDSNDLQELARLALAVGLDRADQLLSKLRAAIG